MNILAKILPLSLVLTILLCQWSWATSVLNTISRSNEGTSVQLFLRFTQLPVFRMESHGKRVDLVLMDTLPVKDFIDVAGDDKMIKMFRKRQPNKLLLSFYFRYPPQNVSVRQIPESASLMLDILLGNPFSARYPDLSAQLHGLTMLNRNEIDYTNPIYTSQYGDKWELFIEHYESSVDIRPKQRFTLPPFPVASATNPELNTPDWLTIEVIDLAEQEEWQQAAILIKDQLEQENEEVYRKLLLLTYAECLVRHGVYQEPYKLLQQIALTYPDTPLAIYANFLFLYVTATHEDPYLAFIELEEHFKQIPSDSPLLPYLNVFYAELALETQRLERAADILKRDDIAFTGETKSLRLLRQADTFYDSGDSIKALVAYRKLNIQSDTLEPHPSSLARYADALYTHQQFAKASEMYGKLVELLSDTDQQDLAIFRLAMSRHHAGEKWTRVLPLLNQIQDAFPGSAGAYRARIKQTDLLYLDGKTEETRAAKEYRQLGIQANRITLREEAQVKQAMVYSLSGDQEASIQQAMAVLRNFRHGELTVEASALVISQLSDVLKTMIAEKRYIDALVLAKKNRLFFVRGWLDSDLLFDLAHAYAELGVYDRAVRAYQYILEISTGEERETVYVPMLTALYNNGQYALIEDYADRYLFRYADSPRVAEVFLLRIQALQETDNLKTATRLLDNPDRPSTPAIERVAASIYFDLQQWDTVISLLTTTQLADQWAGNERDYLLAESYFQNGQLNEARAVFVGLQEADPYIDQAMFRLAEIELQQGNPEMALKQFQKLAEKGKDTRWIIMAREEINIMQLTNALDN